MRIAYLIKGMRLDLRELVLHVIWIHGADLLSRGRAQYLDDFHQLVNPRLAWEQWLAQHQLCHHAASRPYICTSIVGKTGLRD